MTDEGKEQTEFFEAESPEEPEAEFVEEQDASLDEPSKSSRGSWLAAIIGLVGVALLFCAIVTCSAAAIALFAANREAASVSGTITYRERMALPPDAVVKVQVEDVSLADAPSQVMGQQVINNPGQVPIPFEVAYNPNEIRDNHTYSVRARIEDGSGKLLFTSTQHYAVITRGNPTQGIEVLVEQVEKVAPEPEEASVSGTITYRERMALPPDAVVTVQVEDVSRADAPSQVMGQQVINNPGQVPIPFDVPYNPSEIQDNHSYSVRARIEDGSGKLLFTSTQHYGVITRDNPTQGIEIVVERVGGGAPEPEPESDLEGIAWILGNTLPDTKVTALFQAGRLAGSSGCNSYKGSYTSSPGAEKSTIEIGPLASTMMMCEQSIMDQENQFLAALQATTAYHVEENVLTLFYPGGTLLFKGETIP